MRYLNPGFNGLWDMLRILFVNVISIMLQKRSFRPEQILNFMRGFKSAILPEMKNCQNGTFEPVHGIQKKKKFQKTSVKRYEFDIHKKYS